MTIATSYTTTSETGRTFERALHVEPIVVELLAAACPWTVKTVDVNEDGLHKIGAPSDRLRFTFWLAEITEGPVLRGGFDREALLVRIRDEVMRYARERRNESPDAEYDTCTHTVEPFEDPRNGATITRVLHIGTATFKAGVITQTDAGRWIRIDAGQQFRAYTYGDWGEVVFFTGHGRLVNAVSPLDFSVN